MGVLSAKALARQDMWQNTSQARKTLETFPMMQGWSIEARELYLVSPIVLFERKTWLIGIPEECTCTAPRSDAAEACRPPRGYIGLFTRSRRGTSPILQHEHCD